ncbi:MAG TPA: YsnF/AvaK domain-containing protein [Archangium sp.]|uniref:YsnF/AvaK domain-containing protein n=1 Tax=Archangium sp. TaxID=1872627 RepID=UPI002E2F32D8|nr:YsnF/AvaK domain-containing protein [Archangium sp.]HEX5745995.1 YsnF/AvaK domain-containing protein [Archangium sp.]
MFQRTQLREGMTVRSIDGEKLGRVFSLGDDAFHIEKGLFFPKDYLVRYADISDIRDGEIILMHGKDSLRSLSGTDKYGTASTGLGTSAGLGTNAGLGTTGLASDTSLRADAGIKDRSWEARRTEEVAIPVHKEELEVTKRDVSAGEVRVHKDVVEEVKTVEVPVRRERVRVERRDVNPDRPAMNASFKEETVVVPLRAEEVDVHKRAVVDEEVVIHKDAIEEERRVAESVRREEVEISTPDEDLHSKRSLNLTPDDDPLLRR